jgi:DNA-binding response OmpR family regulator
MQYQVAILSADESFARMLEVEFSLLGLKVFNAKELRAEDRAQIVILDLDSATPPSVGVCKRLIGFSRKPAITAEGARRCSMILRRPFRVSLLREEILEELGRGFYQEPASVKSSVPPKRKLALDMKNRALLGGEQPIPLSPQEFRLMQCLLEKRGTVASYAELQKRLGGEDANRLRVYICHLRNKTKKLREGGLIQTVRGQGYSIL